MELQGQPVNRLRSHRRVKGPGRLMRQPPCALVILCLTLVQTLNPAAATAQAKSADEYAVKAAMLYNLTRFVDWPPEAYPDQSAPTVLCILGRDPFEGFLTSLVAKPITKGRPVQIHHPKDVRGVHGCHILYISSSDRKELDQILANVKGANVLTVGEMSQFAAHGGMVQFSMDEKQVHFDINLEATSQADLRISSRLLALARIVKNRNADSGGGASAIPSWGFERVSSAFSQHSGLKR